MNPQMVAKAARLTVVACHMPDLFHVVGGTAAHIVKRRGDQLTCDCQASKFGVGHCTHRIATMWYLDKASTDARKAV